MTSTIPAGTARESTLVRAITTRQFPEYDVGPLPDIVTTLLLAMCDPNDQGAPPRSTLELAIRHNDASLLELLLQFQADPQMREAGQEFPLSWPLPEDQLAAFRSSWHMGQILALLSKYLRWITQDQGLLFAGVRR